MRASAMGRLAAGVLLPVLSFAGIARADGDGRKAIRMSDALTPRPAGVTTMDGKAAIGL